MLKIKTIYETAENRDGFRILIDNEWPNRISKEKMGINLWIKDIAPSKELNSWFKNNPSKWNEFQEKYLKELHNNKKVIKELKILTKFNKTVTLVHSNEDKKHNSALILLKLLNEPPKQIRTGISRTHGC
ncbi:DUF488 domain-containing protein [Methanobacterium sp. SMA-27]|uniref:DUF488 domain-containing protein n=1 Tax=Methanobacterium sp. SMA-27 TaxID=1495336 RepID=UPI00064F491B|nr:DUF488 family protein [Methanobacterium sp. SMA-27]